ncbi:hypothetical protein PV409_37960 [Streptomyces sp. ME02-6979.5a]|uniref:hypothetical protein n=1 Tax=unclassified Streptomyces TaxID=2593676 RepID=UPI0029AE2B0B|nr:MULTISPECIES: hypothetical protein [unclassified Streptomyces]MDX3343740.1 hypothetical protein [Streptomyces sp. ME02-6979.5a]MDX5526208.1 hypothetical protein [Streptomyces sp. DE06-01C]
MAAITTGTLPGFPRWVGATAELHSEVRNGDTLTLTLRIPRVRGLLYAAWLHLTRKTP